MCIKFCEQYIILNILKETPPYHSIMSSEVGETLGRCKWFNGRKGFGFITTVGTDDPTDVFVHHSNVRVTDEQYKYLVEGEYVSFNLTETSEGEHKHQASNVTGVMGGRLMCETRNDNRENGQQQWQSSGRSNRGGGRRPGGGGHH